MHFLSYWPNCLRREAVRRLAQLPPITRSFSNGSQQKNRLYIIAGTHPVIQRPAFHAAHLLPQLAKVFRQRKWHLTQRKRTSTKSAGGMVSMFTIQSTAGSRSSYVTTSSFPESRPGASGRQAPRSCLFPLDRQPPGILPESVTVPKLAQSKPNLCRHGRDCRQSAPVPHVTTNYSQAAIMTPSDYFFARDGIAAEGNINQEADGPFRMSTSILLASSARRHRRPAQDLIKMLTTV